MSGGRSDVIGKICSHDASWEPDSETTCSMAIDPVLRPMVDGEPGVDDPSVIPGIKALPHNPSANRNNTSTRSHHRERYWYFVA